MHCGLRALSDRRAAACTKFIQRVRDTGVLANLLAQRTSVSHGSIYNQAPSERIPPWPLITVSINLLPIDILS